MLASLLATGGCTPMRYAPLPGPPRGRVVLLRGLANIFSTGLNVLTAQLRAADFDATVHNHTEWDDLTEATLRAARAGRLVRPFAVVGHSLGADDAIRLAGALGAAGVASDLLVTFDPTWVTQVPPGPLRVVNYYQAHDGVERVLSAGPGFSGKLENRLVRDANHLTIEKEPRLHDQVIAMLEGLHAALAAPQPPMVTVRAPDPVRAGR